MHIDQDQGHALPLRKALEGAANEKPQIGAVMIVAPIRQIQFAEIGRATQHRALATETVEAGIDHDAVHAGAAS